MPNVTELIRPLLGPTHPRHAHETSERLPRVLFETPYARESTVSRSGLSHMRYAREVREQSPPVIPDVTVSSHVCSVLSHPR